MKNILIISQSLKIGLGAEKIVSQVGNYLQENGYNIIFFTFEDSKNKYKINGKYYNLSKKFRYGYGIKKIFDSIIFAKEIAKLSKNQSIDLVIANAEFSCVSLALSKILFGLRSKTIAVSQATLAVWNFIIRSILFYFLNISDKIVVVSEEEKLNFINKYGFNNKKIETIYNTIDIRDIQEKSNLSLLKDDAFFVNNYFTFITSGRLTYQKNQKDLIISFDKFWQKNNETQLLILGEGLLREELIALKNSLASKDNIHFLGVRKNPYNIIHKSDCFVLTSVFEGLPIVVLECMALGKPIISSNCPTGPSELLSHGRGILVDLNSNFIPNLVDSFIKIYKNQGLRKSISNKSSDYINSFDTKNILPKRKYLVESLLK